jgi:hypothetical protein
MIWSALVQIDALDPRWTVQMAVASLVLITPRSTPGDGTGRRRALLAPGHGLNSALWPDAFEQELLTDIAEAEAIGENGVAA